MARALHDMGGVERFYGPIERETNEPAFHERWEARTFGLSMAVGGVLGANLDAVRDAMERLEPDVYLRGYWVRWLHAIEREVVAQQFLAQGAVDARLDGTTAAGDTTRELPRFRRVLMTHLVRKVMAPMPPWLLRTYPRLLGFSRKTTRRPAFAPGDRVRALAQRPPGHTRIPGYVCGRQGRIIRRHGAMVFPDVHARREEEDPQHLYTVAFTSAEVWGEGAEAGVTILVDLFEPYLEAA